MKKHAVNYISWLLAILFLFTLSVVGKGCKDSRDRRSVVAPSQSGRPGVSMKIIEGTSTQAKATGVTVEIVVVDEFDVPIDTEEPISVTIPNPMFPLEIPLTMYVPPCRYQITITVPLVRDPQLRYQFIADACQGTEVTIPIDDFEPMIVPGNPIDAPGSANAGETIIVRCGPSEISAPDSDRAPVFATLWEEDGRGSVSGPIGSTDFVEDDYPDPYPLTSPQTRRVFSCEIVDGRSANQMFTRVVSRILPTPTPSPTATATPMPTEVILWEAIPSVPGNLAALVGGTNRTVWDTFCQLSATGLAATKTNHVMFIATDGTPLTGLGIPATVPLRSNAGTQFALDLNTACSGGTGVLTQSLQAAGVTGSDWWSGADPFCNVTLDNCSNWTNGFQFMMGVYGDSGSLADVWVSGDLVMCDSPYAYLCASW